MPDNDLLDAKLESLRRCLNRIASKTPATKEQLLHDYDAQDILSVNLQRAVQISVDLASHLISDRGWQAPGTMADTFAVLAAHNALDSDLATSLARAVGFRNIAVHEYQEVDWGIVYLLCTEQLTVFREYAAAISAAWSTPPE